MVSALCWSHSRRKFFVLADIAGKLRKGKPAHDISPVALEAVKRIDAIFYVEREINGLSVEEHLEVRNRLSRPLVDSLHEWMLTERVRMSKHADAAKAIAYMIDKDQWDAFTRFLDDGRICLTNNAAERALRGIALGRRVWLFAGSERDGDRAVFMYTLVGTAKLNDIDPQAWLADVLAKRIGEAVELVEIIVSNNDNIGYGEITHVNDGSEYGIKALTDHGIENLKDLLANIRLWEGGIHQFLVDEQCDPDVINRIMAIEKAN